MDKKLIKQKIQTNIEQLKIFWAIEIVLAGGLVAVLMTMDSFIKMFLFILGIIIFAFFFSGITLINKNLYCLSKLWKGK